MGTFPFKIALGNGPVLVVSKMGYFLSILPKQWASVSIKK